ncbi:MULTISPECIES: selenocysteine-specific translation elongation factor [Comamonas]|uniref:selenocysteine-specific translation elongation factor n=1 Tax=Comamonas TaxID=283 RepID=UPI0006220E77|nr:MULTISPECIES: selenocysteine-specific translation elongation factor [Comamonas]KKI12777.1 translation elongation factor [Comamonas thiooxydans]TYK77556.1 selenocysteine-specific translation elongation factor [Comamonas sp. Z1]BCX53221.1 selenocysteine-specific translation factor [Comamonas testosteroni]
MIIGTAGHIDHGKTTLVRALTGVETDRLKEEKARGISIELGYAYSPLPNGDVLGIIDVPGHEKFVHTMAAGAVGIDHALLVVAADDGVMPQTLEHLEILQLLGVRRGSVALTKVDRVLPQRIADVHREINAILGVTALADSPIFETNAAEPDNAGVKALREHLQVQAQMMQARPRDGLFRLAVDRVFTLSGQGTVVTGTVFNGQVRVGDTLAHSASGRAVRVRSIHAQNQSSDSGVAGQRCALNLAGIGKDEIERGDWIMDQRLLQATDRLDIHLHQLSEAPLLAQWTPVHVHLGTKRTTGHVALLQDEAIEPGTEARVQLVLDALVFALPGDRLILRNAQASRTIAGGMVLDPYAPSRKRRSAERMAYLDAMEQLIARNDFRPLIAQAPHGIARSQLVRLSGHAFPEASLADTIQLPIAGGDALVLGLQRWQQLQTQLIDSLARFHEKSPDEPGVNAARLRRMALPGLQQGSYDALYQGLVDALLNSQLLASTGAWLHLPQHSVQLSSAEQTLAEKLLPAIAAGRYDPPWVRDLARDHAAGEELVRQLLKKLSRQGQLFQVVKDLFYAPVRMDELAALVADIASQHARGEVEASAFRDATGLGRKRAIQILEFFDRTGYTRRVRDAHLLRPDVHWNSTPR